LGTPKGLSVLDFRLNRGRDEKSDINLLALKSFRGERKLVWKVTRNKGEEMDATPVPEKNLRMNENLKRT